MHKIGLTSIVCELGLFPVRVAILRGAGGGVLAAGHFLFPVSGFDFGTTFICSFIVLTYHNC